MPPVLRRQFILDDPLCLAFPTLSLNLRLPFLHSSTTSNRIVKYLPLVLGYLAFSVPYISCNGNVIPSNPSHTALNIVSRKSSRIMPRHEHKSGEPYLATSVYFGHELPEDKSGWVPTGSFAQTYDLRHAPQYQSINPATGQLRNPKGDCAYSNSYHLMVPPDSECCYTFFWTLMCRTYKLKPTPHSIMSGVVSVLANGRAAGAVDG